MGCCWEREQGKVQGSGGDHDDDGEDDDGAAASRQRLRSASEPGTGARFSRTLSFEPHWDPPKQRLRLSLSDRGEKETQKRCFVARATGPVWGQPKDGHT